MGRPPKKGLSYHSSDVDYYDDFKIIALLDRFGPAGQTIYDVILKMVYRNGYYLEIPMDKLTLSVTRTIGSKWIRNKDLVLQVVQYCADIGLFDKDLSLQSVITSVGIQKRYELATVRNKVQMEKYRLLEKESEEPLLNVPKKSVSATENGVSATETQVAETKTPTNKRKLNTIDNTAFSPPELEDAFQMYLLVRKSNYGDILPEQIVALREDLISLSSDHEEQLAIVKKATASSWKSFYGLKRRNGKQSEKKPKSKPDKFNNFEGRSYEMDNLEEQLLKADMRKN